MPVTPTVIVQASLAAIAAPLRLIVEVPAVAVIGAVPKPQVVPRPLGVAISRPPGRTSEKLTPVKALALGFVMLKVSGVVPPCTMGVVVNDFASVGGSGRGQPRITTSSRTIVAAALLPPSEEILKVVVDPDASAGIPVNDVQAVLLLDASG